MDAAVSERVRVRLGVEGDGGRKDRGGGVEAGSSPRVLVASAAFASMDAHRDAPARNARCGLLLGRREGDGIVIARSLRCVNEKGGGGGFAIETRAILNVARTLRGKPIGVVGFYYLAEGGELTPTARDRVTLRDWPEALWLIAPVSGSPATAPRLWWLGGRNEPRELVLEPLPEHVPRPLTCPD